MSYEIYESVAQPVLEGLQLGIAGEVVASAAPVPHSTIGHWRIQFGIGLFAGVPDADHARELLAWLGEKLTPLTEITGPEDLHRAPVGSVWLSDYAGGNKYRVNKAGKWQWRGADDVCWYSCLDANNDGPYKDAYPLRPVSE